MNKECRLFLAVALTAAVCACRCYGDAEDTLKELRDKPSDVSLLIKLKGDIAGIKDTDEKCRLGVIYCLGTIAFGNASEGLTVKDGMAKAYKSCPMLNELSDENIYDDCVQCEGGKNSGDMQQMLRRQDLHDVRRQRQKQDEGLQRR
jgi:hypothetical protein